MTTREIAYRIIDGMTEEQLEEFFALYENYQRSRAQADDMHAAYERIKAMSKPVPDFDEEKELAEWREEK